MGPQVLPDGDWVLFTLAVGVAVAGPGRWDEAQIVVQSLESGERKVLWNGGSDARYVPTGHLVFARGDVLFSVVFDVNGPDVKGGPIPIVEGVERPQSGSTGTANYGFSDQGTLAYVQGGGGVTNGLVWVDRQGKAEPLPAPPHNYRHPSLSPDGQRIAVTIGESSSDIWLYEIVRNTLTRLTFEGLNHLSLWTPDAERVLWRSAREGGPGNLYWKLADGSGAADQLTTKRVQTKPRFLFAWTAKSSPFINALRVQEIEIFGFCP